MSSVPVALIFGAGSNVGQAVAKAFAAEGYKVAVLARRLQEGDSKDGQYHITGDLADPGSVVEAFEKTKAKLGTPSVVIYNAYGGTPSPKDDPLSLEVESFAKALTVNTTSAFVAAQQAIKAFAQLPSSASKTFIFTGNALNTLVSLPGLLTLGVGKSATGFLIQNASEAYQSKGYKFYFADERTEDGKPVYNRVDGPAHAAHYVELAEGKEQGPWQQTFVKSIGYKHFSLPTPL